MKRVLHIIALVVGWTAVGAVGIVCLALAAGFFAAKSDWGHRHLLAFVLPRIEDALDGKLKVGGFHGDLLHGLVLENVEVLDREGQAAVRAQKVTASYNLAPLIHKTVQVNQLNVDGLWVRARYIADGQLNLATLIKPTPKTPPAKHPLVIKLGHVLVNGEVAYEPPAGTEGPLGQTAHARLHLDGTTRIAGPRIDVQLEQLEMLAEAPLAARLVVGGGAHIDGSAISLEHAAITLATRGEEVGKLAPKAELSGPFAARLDADGTLARMTFKAVVEPPRGKMSAHGSLGLDADGALDWNGDVEMHDVDPAAATALVPHGMHGMIVLAASAHGKGRTGLVHVENLDVNALDAHVSAHGDLDLAGFGDVEVSLRAQDLSRLSVLGVFGLGGALDAHAKVNRSKEHIAIDGELKGAKLRRDALSLADVNMRIHTVDILGDLALSAHGLHGLPRRFDTLHLTAHGTREVLGAHLDASGSEGFFLGFDLKGKPLWNQKALTGIDTRIEQFKLSNRKVAWRSQGAARLRVAPTFDSIEIEHFALAAGAQRIALDARYGLKRKDVAAYLTTRQVDVASLMGLLKPAPKIPPTAVDLEVRVSGTTPDLVATAKVFAVATREDKGAQANQANQAPKTDKVDGLDRMELRAEARYAAARVQGQLELKAPKNVINGRFNVPLDAKASGSASAPMDLDLALKGTQLETLRPYLPASLSDLKGDLSAGIRAHGTLGNPTIAGEVRSKSWQFGASEIDGKPVSNSSEVTLSYERGLFHVANKTSLAGGGGQLDAGVELPLDLRALMAEPARAFTQFLRTAPVKIWVNFKGLDIAKFQFESMGISRPLSTGLIDASLNLGGTIYRPEVHGTLSAKDISKEAYVDKLDARLAIDWAVSAARMAGSVDLRGQRLVDLSAHTQLDLGQMIEHAGPTWKQTPLDVTVTIPSYNLARLQGMQPQLEKLAGTLDGTIHATGDFVHQLIESNISIKALHLGEADFEQLAMTGTFDGQTIKAKLDAAQKSGGQFHALATVPLDKNAAWKLGLDAKRFDLAFLGGTLEALRSTRGLLDSTIGIAGTQAKPTLDADLRVTKAAIQLRIDPHLYDKIELEAHLHQGALQLKNLSAASGDGTLKATGDAVLEGFAPTRFDLKAETHKFALVMGSLAAWLDSDIAVHAEGTAHHLRARVEVHKGTVKLPKLASDRKLQPIGEPARVTFVDRQAKKEAAAHAQAESGGGSEAGITVKIPGPFYIRSKDANAELKGNLELVVRNSDVSLNGSAETNTGWIDLLGQRYTIDHARVGFGGDPSSPELDLRITRRITDATIVAEVHGTARKPQLDLFADPPIYDKSQILGIILSGDPAGQRVSDRGLDQKVVGAVSGMVLGKLKDAIAPSLPIDLIHVETGDAGYTGLAQTRVEVGKYITENLYVSYIHQFGQPASNAVTNSNEARVEYRFKRRYELDTSFGDAGVGGVDLFWTLRY